MKGKSSYTRFFEVKLTDGHVMALSEAEVENLRPRIEEVRSEFTAEETKELRLCYNYPLRTEKELDEYLSNTGTK